MGTITENEKTKLLLADSLDKKRIDLYGRYLNCVGAVNMFNEARGLRSEVRAAVYRRGGEATGLPCYKDAYIRAGCRAVLAAGFSA
jgi:hypothetical protein